MKSHETKFKTMSAELLEHRSSLPEKKVKGKEYEELKQKEEYLEFEVSWETHTHTYPTTLSPSVPVCLAILSDGTVSPTPPAELYHATAVVQEHEHPPLPWDAGWCGGTTSISSLSWDAD